MYYRLIDPLLPLMQHLPFAANALDSKTKRYFVANAHHLKFHGFTQVEESLHITMDQLFERRTPIIVQMKGSLEREAHYRVTMTRANYQVLQQNKSMQFILDSLSLSGAVVVRKFSKIPLSDSLKVVNAILTYAEDVTHQCSRFNLYQLYQMHYSDKVYAIQLFLKHIGIAHFFDRLPTHRELATLLTMCEQDAAKYIAIQLKIHPRTVEEYKARLREKISQLSLDQLLIVLRGANTIPLKKSSHVVVRDYEEN